MLETLRCSAKDTLSRIDDQSSLQEEVASKLKEKLPKIYRHELIEAIFQTHTQELAI